MSQSAEAENHDAAAGAWLRAARERASLSIEQVAKSLNLEVRKIQAIENEKFNELGAPVYAKGYLRKYARLVAVPEDELIQRYQGSHAALTPSDPVPVTLGMIPAPKRLPRWALWLVTALLLAAAGVVLWSLRSEPAPAAIAPPLSTTSITDSPLQSLPELSSLAKSTEGAVQLVFRFSSDSWVEVYDASNTQTLYDLGKTGEERTVTATPPLRVVLGSATGVTTHINGQAAVIPASRISDDVARFVVTAGGGIEP